MTHVFLVRHGQASAGTDNYDKLSETGIKQAQLLGDHWKQSGFHVDAAFHGSLQRQKHTAELALAGIGHEREVDTLHGLNEYDHTTIDRLYGEGVTSDGADSLQFSQYKEIMARWRDATHTNEAQSWQDFSMQGWNAIQSTVENHFKQTDTNAGKNANLVFFTSGGIIATVLQQLLSFNFESTMQALWQTRNASVTNLLFNKDGAWLVDYNTVPHLQSNQNKHLITQI